MKRILTIAAALTLATPVALACPGKEKMKTASIAVKDAAAQSKAGKVIMVDANGAETRKKEGVVPGARLLTNYKSFKMSELKADKKDTLVFYCYSEQCSAAPKAAQIAKDKGYKTKVMEAGIMGWKKAGHPVKRI